jgi:hypothetical protein
MTDLIVGFSSCDPVVLPNLSGITRVHPAG